VLVCAAIAHPLFSTALLLSLSSISGDFGRRLPSADYRHSIDLAAWRSTGGGDRRLYTPSIPVISDAAGDAEDPSARENQLDNRSTVRKHLGALANVR
jgi:hypothetical protein